MKLFHCWKYLPCMIIKKSTVNPSLSYGIATSIFFGKPPKNSRYIGSALFPTIFPRRR